MPIREFKSSEQPESDGTMEYRKTRLPHINTLLAKSLLLSAQPATSPRMSASDRLIQQQLQVLDAVEEQLGDPGLQRAHPMVFR